MLITFTCKSHENVMMFGDIAIKLIKMMGQSGAVPSAILAKQVPHALSLLQKALAEEKNKPSPLDKEALEESDDAPISLAHRAFPLIELLQNAIDKECDVLWS